MHRRIHLAPLFMLALAFGYRASVSRLQGIRTEEGQLVAFPRGPFLQRELSKMRQKRGRPVASFVRALSVGGGRGPPGP